MRTEEILENLERDYPDTLEGIETKEQLEERKVQIKLINHIRLMVTPQKKRSK